MTSNCIIRLNGYHGCDPCLWGGAAVSGVFIRRRSMGENVLSMMVVSYISRASFVMLVFIYFHYILCLSIVASSSREGAT